MENLSKDGESFYSLFVPFTNKKAIILIIIIGFFVFFNMLFNGFVWDDITYITNNPVVYVFNLIRLFSVNPFNYGGYFRPISAVYFSLLYTFFGPQAFYFHLFQLILHIIDTCLLFVFFKKFFKLLPSFILSLIFLIHPIQVESVTYIGASQSELLFFFGMTAVLISTRKYLTTISLLGMSLSLLIAFLTKETSILFLFIIFFYQLLLRRKEVLRLLPFLLSTVVAYFVIRLSIFHIPFKENLSTPISNLPLYWRILNIPLIFFYYIKTFFYPAVLGIDQRWIVTSLDATHFYLPLLIDTLFFCILGFLGYLCFKKNIQTFHLFIFFFLWFILGMGILMQLVPLDMTVSERWFYFPIVGLLGMIGLATNFIKIKLKTQRSYIYLLIVIILILLGSRSYVRNTNWTDPTTLYTHDIRIDDNEDLELMLGTQLENESHYKEALPYLSESLHKQTTKLGLVDTGVAYEYLGDRTQALNYYKMALKTGDTSLTQDTINQVMDINIGVIYLNDNKSTVAIDFLQKAIKNYPRNAKLWLFLAIAYYKEGLRTNAISDAEKAYSLYPNPIYKNVYIKMRTEKNYPFTVN